MIGRKTGIVLTVLITASSLLFYYSHDIFNADHLAYGAWGDGYKNFYTLAYYVKYDRGACFSGMNYPYGENVLFTDNQLAIAFILSATGKIFPCILNHLHAVLALVLFSSMLFCSVVIYLLLLEFEVSAWLAVVLSTFITMMNPQWDHFLGLYSLAYCVFIPSLLLFSLKLLTTTKKLYYGCLGAGLITFFSFVHLYNLGFSLFYLCSLTAVWVIFHRNNLKKYVPDIFGLTAMAVLPLLVVKIFLLFTDTVSDRPSSPWGYFEGATRLHYLLLHPNSFIYSFLKSHWQWAADRMKFGYDAKCFLGIITVTLICSYIVLLVKCFATQKIMLSSKEKMLALFFLSSIPVLLFAMAIPLELDAFKPFYESLPSSIKQFRAAARFSWVFYYTASLISAVTLHHFFVRLKPVNKLGAYLFLGTALVIWFIDMNTTSNFQKENFKNFSSEIDERGEGVVRREKLLKAGYDFSSFQAILPLPFFSIGSEKLSISSPANFASMSLSLASGLPLVCGQMSRTSVSQSLKIANLLSESYVKKEIVNDYHNQKPLLLIAVNKDFSPNEKTLIEKADYLFEHDGAKFYKLPLWAFKDSTDGIKQFVINNFHSFRNHVEYLSDSDTFNIVYKTISDKGFGEDGAKQFSNNFSFFQNALPNGKDQTNYEFSIWLYADKELPGMPVIDFKEFDSTGIHIIFSTTLEGKYSTNTFHNWVRVSTNFILTNRKNIISVTGKNKHSSYDELMIRPLNVNTITGFENDSTFQFNNYPIR